ncbi:hypothetical protein SeMB42_g00773 [Synchytrium endobioticum]|uniref:Uncharacterized protein n=1 Tax=Synchytrium endobioticum TaxID=286115 RepID=A0A507DPD6_9FUNG|nr:hypothetical protein SeMB42_g00775 [Synchytrium endobioticum]TPX53463.1 hypothetical protein SeMB42_g00773 [Synchytrium endobioticum]
MSYTDRVSICDLVTLADAITLLGPRIPKRSGCFQSAEAFTTSPVYGPNAGRSVPPLQPPAIESFSRIQAVIVLPSLQQVVSQRCDGS